MVGEDIVNWVFGGGVSSVHKADESCEAFSCGA